MSEWALRWACIDLPALNSSEASDTAAQRGRDAVRSRTVLLEKSPTNIMMW